MKLHITHQTNYAYAAPAKRSIQYIRMTPRIMAHQHTHRWQVMLPNAAYRQLDGFGNTWLTVDINYPHTALTIQAAGVVEINHDTTYVKDSGRVPYLIFTVPTPLTHCDDAMWAFGAPYLHTLTPTVDSLPALQAFAAALLAYMPYTHQMTNVATTAAEAFAKKAGVCQDHTHVFLACIRRAGLAGRYVSGYLYDPHSNHMASHAWAEVWLAGHWYTFDVVNQQFTPNVHVYVAVGRDYLDAAPVRGVRIGGGDENLLSQVLVTKVT